MSHTWAFGTSSNKNLKDCSDLGGGGIRWRQQIWMGARVEAIGLSRARAEAWAKMWAEADLDGGGTFGRAKCGGSRFE